MSQQSAVPLVADGFVRLWEPRHDEIENDEPAYREILYLVRAELALGPTITAATMMWILDWKSPTTKGKIDWLGYDEYVATLMDV